MCIRDSTSAAAAPLMPPSSGPVQDGGYLLPSTPDTVVLLSTEDTIVLPGLSHPIIEPREDNAPYIDPNDRPFLDDDDDVYLVPSTQPELTRHQHASHPELLRDPDAVAIPPIPPATTSSTNIVRSSSTTHRTIHVHLNDGAFKNTGDVHFTIN